MLKLWLGLLLFHSSNALLLVGVVVGVGAFQKNKPSSPTTTTATRRRLRFADRSYCLQRLAARPHRASSARNHHHDEESQQRQHELQRRVVAVKQELELLHRLQQKQQQQQCVDDETSSETSNNGVARRTEIAEEALDILTTTTTIDNEVNGVSVVAPAITRRRMRPSEASAHLDDDGLWNRNADTLELSVLQVPLDSPSAASHPTQSSTKAILRMIVISDTHGFEQQLFDNNNTTLPDADLLVHCGDFASSGARTTKLQARQLLDEWLSQQRHIPTKLIVRGNHDPHHARGNLFPLSQATYITKPTTLQISSQRSPNNKRLTICMRPYSRRKDVVLLPESCDVLISHEPPLGLLDLAYTNQNAGSKVLRKSVEASLTKPKVWLCGHIHEGRGSILHSFHAGNVKEQQPTLVINAANANSGRANRLVTGPVVVEVVDSLENEGMKRVWNETIRQMQRKAGLAKPTAQRDSLEAMRLATDASLGNRRLLAVDLGHPTTKTALLDDKGNLLEVRKWRITDKATLDEALHELLSAGVVTHVVVESSDAKLFRIWKRAISSRGEAIQLARVLSDDWKLHFSLKTKENQARNQSNIRGKTVAIARKYADERGDTDKKLVKDAAQAILVGYYALNILGWTDIEPLRATHYSTGQS